MPSTAYQRLQKAAGAACRGTGTKATLRKAATAYVKQAADPVKAKKTAARLLAKPCSIAPKKRKSAVAGTKKTTRKRATTATRRKAKR